LLKVLSSVPVCGLCGVALGTPCRTSYPLQVARTPRDDHNNPRSQLNFCVVASQLAVLFVGMTAVNCVGTRDRLPKVMGGVSFVLGILWPTVYKVGGYPSPVPRS
jgi:hypothetical protein